MIVLAYSYPKTVKFYYDSLKGNFIGKHLLICVTFLALYRKRPYCLVMFTA